MNFPQQGVPGVGQPTAQQQQQQQHHHHLQRLFAMGAIPAMGALGPIPGAGLALPASFQQAQASQLQLQAALAQNPALQVQFAQQLQQQALLAQRAQLAQPQATYAPAAPSLAAAAPAAKPPAAAQLAKPAAPAAPGAASAAAKAPAAAAKLGLGGQPVVKQGEAMPARKAGSIGPKKRKAADTRIIDKVNQLIPESPLFTQMQDAERRADLLIQRKKAELQEMYASFRRGPPGTPQAGGAIRKKLRVYIFNEHANQQQWQHEQQRGASQAGAPTEPPSWALHIQGRLVDGAAEPHQSGVAPAAYQPRHPFTHYIRKLQVQLDPSQFPGAEGRVSWDKSRHDREHRDSFEVRRRGSQPCTATITLELDYQPQQLSLSPPLSSMLGLTGLHSLPYIMQLLWGYIKQHGLYQSGQTPLMVRCDEKMRAAFGGPEAIPLTDMQEVVRRACRAPDPAIIKYTVRTDGPSPTHPDCYDFDFEVALGHELPPFASKTTVDKDIQAAEHQLSVLIHKLNEHKRRRTFFMAFAQNPVDFVNALISTQARELRIASSKEGEALEVLAAGDVFRDKWVEDAVMRYLHRKMGAGVH